MDRRIVAEGRSAHPSKIDKRPRKYNVPVNMKRAFASKNEYTRKRMKSASTAAAVKSERESKGVEEGDDLDDSSDLDDSDDSDDSSDSEDSDDSDDSEDSSDSTLLGATEHKMEISDESNSDDSEGESKHESKEGSAVTMSGTFVYVMCVVCVNTYIVRYDLWRR